MREINPKIEISWKHALKDEFNSEYFYELKSFLVEEKNKHVIYPPGSEIFSAFDNIIAKYIPTITQHTNHGIL